MKMPKPSDEIVVDKIVVLDERRATIWMAKESWTLEQSAYLLNGLIPDPPENDDYEVDDLGLKNTVCLMYDFLMDAVGDVDFPSDVLVRTRVYVQDLNEMLYGFGFRPLRLVKWLNAKGIAIQSELAKAYAKHSSGGPQLLNAKEKRHLGVLLEMQETLPEYLKAAFTAGVYFAKLEGDVLIEKKDVWDRVYAAGCKNTTNEIHDMIWKLIPANRRRNRGRYPKKS